MERKDNKTPSTFIPLEITSPRTAEVPGPVADACCTPGGTAHAHGTQAEAKASYVPTILSFLLLATGLLLDYLNSPWFSGYLRLGTYGISYLLVGWRVLRHAITSLKSSFFNEFFLMSIATLGAFYLGEYAEGVAVMLFYVVGEHFQEAAVLRSRRSIKALIDNRPAEVGLLTDQGVS